MDLAQVGTEEDVLADGSSAPLRIGAGLNGRSRPSSQGLQCKGGSTPRITNTLTGGGDDC